MQERTGFDYYNGGDALDKRAETMIEREVYANQSWLIEQFLEKEIFSIEEIDNLDEAICGSCGSTNIIEEDDEQSECSDCGITEDTDYQPKEVLEYCLGS